MSFPPSRAHARILVAAATAGLAGLIAAPSADAGAFEQVSRQNGGAGTSLWSNEAEPVFASDTGRFAITWQIPFLDGIRLSTEGPTNLRDIVANTTRLIARKANPVPTYGTRVEVVEDVDNAETTMLVSRPTASGLTWILRPISGGADRIITTGTSASDYANNAALSGNGKTLAVPDGGLKVVNVSTGASRVYAGGTPEFDDQSISDDGAVVAGTLRYPTQGFSVIRGVYKELPSPAQVSPDGSILVTRSAAGVVVQKISDGTQRTITPPAGAGLGDVVWISPDGQRVAFAASVAGGQARVLTVATGAWAVFGGAHSASINDESKISRSGRYAVLEYNENRVTGSDGFSVSQAALVDLTGADLPGAQEALSASSYLPVTPPVADNCDQAEDAMEARFGRPAPWLPAPKSAELTITIDGVQAIHKVFSAPTTTVTSIPFEQTAKSVTIKAKVVDDQNRTLTTEQTIAKRCYTELPL